MKLPLFRDLAYGVVAVLLFIAMQLLADRIGVPSGVLPK